MHHADVEYFDLRLDAVFLQRQPEFLQKPGMVLENRPVQPVQGSAVIGRQFREQRRQRPDTLFVAEADAAGTGNIDADVAIHHGPDAFHSLLVFGEIRGGASVIIAHMDVGNGGAGLPAGIHIGRDFLRRDRQVGIVLARGPGTGEGGADYSFVCKTRHRFPLIDRG